MNLESLKPLNTRQKLNEYSITVVIFYYCLAVRFSDIFHTCLAHTVSHMVHSIYHFVFSNLQFTQYYDLQFITAAAVDRLGTELLYRHISFSSLLSVDRTRKSKCLRTATTCLINYKHYKNSQTSCHSF